MIMRELCERALLRAFSLIYAGGCLSLFRFLIRGFSINPSVHKLWHEKANMQISMYLSRPVLVTVDPSVSRVG